MILLDTDDLSVFAEEHDPRHGRSNERVEPAAEPVAFSIVSVEDVLRGWLAIIDFTVQTCDAQGSRTWRSRATTVIGSECTFSARVGSAATMKWR